MQERGSVSRSNTAYPKLQEITAFGSLQSLRAAGPRSIVARPSRLRVPVASRHREEHEAGRS